tara:strand:- start:4392 stop:5477 length:1086 start_codon:yes stop_codon:yes gene_type:complete
MNWIKNISVLLISILISLFICELVLGYLKPIDLRSDPKWVPDGFTRGHYLPNETIQGSVGHNVRNPNLRIESAEYTLNKYGYRGSDWNILSPKSIAFYGGSSTFSFHDNDEDAWPFITINCLNKNQEIQYQNLNFSHPGNSIFDAPHLLLQKGIHFNSDWIITYHLWNDIKFIRALSENSDFIFNTNPSDSSITLKSVLLDLGIFHNLLGNINVIYRKFINRSYESSFDLTKNVNIKESDIDSTLSIIKDNYVALINLSSPSQKFLFIKQGLLLDENNNSYDAEISWELIGLNKVEFLKVQSDYYSMIDSLAKDNANVYFLDADKIIPKNLEMYDDHVHLQRKAQKILGESVCEYIKKINI